MGTTTNLEDHLAGHIEVGDDDTSDIFSLNTVGSDTTSISPSVFEYVYENGRRYKSDRATKGEYLLPNDETEQERLDLTHHMYNIMLKGELFLAPLVNPRRVLDLGTGTGIWAVDFGDMFPEAEVLGNDLSPIQPTWVPDNVKFEVDDFEEDWSYSQPFDYIHGRSLVGSVKDWPRLLKQAYANLTPGGYVEFIDFDHAGAYSTDGSYEGSTMQKYAGHIVESAALMGRPMDVTPKLGDFMREAGFVNVSKAVYKQPFGSWPKDPHYKELGRVSNAVVQTGVEAYGLAAFTRVLQWEVSKARELIEGTLRDVNNRKMHQIALNYVFVGQKPLEEEGSDGGSCEGQKTPLEVDDDESVTREEKGKSS